MLVAIPAALIGVLVAALSVYKKGLELEDDPEYQQRVADGLVKDFKKKVEGEKQVTKKAKISVAIFLVSMVVIAICGIFPALRPTFSENGCILFLISRKKASGCAAGFQTFSFFG